MRFVPKYTSDSTRDVLYTSDSGFAESDLLADTALHTGPYILLRVLADAVVTITMQGPGAQGNSPSGGRINPFPPTALTSLALKAGTNMPGSFATLQLTSGVILAEKGT